MAVTVLLMVWSSSQSNDASPVTDRCHDNPQRSLVSGKQGNLPHSEYTAERPPLRCLPAYQTTSSNHHNRYLRLPTTSTRHDRGQIGARSSLCAITPAVHPLCTGYCLLLGPCVSRSICTLSGQHRREGEKKGRQTKHQLGEEHQEQH